MKFTTPDPCDFVMRENYNLHAPAKKQVGQEAAENAKKTQKKLKDKSLFPLCVLRDFAVNNTPLTLWLEGQCKSGKYHLFRDYLWICGVSVLEIKIFVEQVFNPYADDAVAFWQPVAYRTVEVPEIVVTGHCHQACRGVCQSAILINIGTLHTGAEP